MDKNYDHKGESAEIDENRGESSKYEQVQVHERQFPANFSAQSTENIDNESWHGWSWRNPAEESLGKGVVKESVTKLQAEVDSRKTLQNAYKRLETLHKTLRTEYQRLETSYKTLETEYQRLETSHKALRNHHAIIQTTFQIEISKLKDENADLSTKLSSVGEEQQRKDSQISSMQYKIDELSMLRVGHKAERKIDQDFIKTLQREKKELRAIAMKAQTTDLDTFSETVPRNLPDDIIERRIGDLLAEARDWAWDNSIGKDLQDCDLIRERLINKGFLVAEERLEPHEHFDMSANYAAEIILETLVTHEFCNKFLQNPYFMAQCTPSKGETQGNNHLLPAAFQSFEGYLVDNKNREQALAWRDKTVRLLSKENRSSRKLRESFYREICIWCLKDWAVFLVDELGNDEKERLLGIIRDFGNLAAELWSLKREIKLVGLDYFGCTDFRAQSPEMTAARTIHLEEGSSELNGRRIALVTRPMIVSYLITENDRASKGIIWAKGVVWASKKKAPMYPMAQMVPFKTTETTEMTKTDMTNKTGEKKKFLEGKQNIYMEQDFRVD